MKKNVLIVLIIFLFGSISFSQGFLLTGNIYNSANKQAIKNVLISIKNLDSDMYSNKRGFFMIYVPTDTATLVIKADGMHEKEITVNKSRNELGELDIILDPKITEEIFDMSVEELLNMEVSGVSRYKQSIADVPNSIQVINKQQIKNRAYFDLSDVLKDIGGFDITANAGQFGEFYSLRGIAGNDRFLVMVNGHKINPATGTQLSIGNSISIRYAERIEIIYGPASAIYGADAFSGIINIIFNEENKNEKVNISSYGNYGSLNTIDAGLRASFNLGKDFSIFASGRMYKSGGPNFINMDTTYYNYDVVKQYTSPLSNKFEQPTDDHSIYFSMKYKNLSLNYFRQQFNEGNALSLNPYFYIYNKENKWKTSTDITWLDYKKELNNEGVLSFDITFKRHIQDNNTIYYKWNVPGVFDASQTYKQFFTGNDNTIHTVVTYNQHFNDNFSLLVGADNEYTKSIPPYANDEILGKPDKFEGSNADEIIKNLTITDNRFAGFGQAVFSPIEIFSFTLGARYDFSTIYGGTFNPRVGLIIKATNSTTFKLNYGKAFQAPSLFYQYEQWGAPNEVTISTSEIQKNNPDWKIENQTISYFEGSLSQKIGENYNIKLTAYYNDLTNLIERVYFTDSVYNKYFNSYTRGLRNENIGEEKINGVELVFNAKLTDKIFLNTFYSYTDAKSIEINGATTDIPRISNNKIWLSLNFQDLFNYITISPRFKWVSSMYNYNSTVYTNNIQPGFYNLDISMSVNNISKYFRIYADVNNVLNQKINHAGLYEQNGIYTAFIPQQGLAFIVGLELFFNK